MKCDLLSELLDIACARWNAQCCEFFESERRGSDASEMSMGDWCEWELQKRGFNVLKERVFLATRESRLVSVLDIAYLFAYVQYKNLTIGRICLHKEQSDPVQEMLIVQNSRHIVGPLRQDSDSDISFHCMFGELEIAHPRWDSKIVLNGKMKESARFPASEPREIVSLTETSIFLEVCRGPFKDSDTQWGMG